MTAREVVTLNETTPQLEAPQSGDTYYLVRDVVCATGAFSSEVVDGATAEAWSLDTGSAYSTSGAKLLSLKNNGTEKAYIDKDGAHYVIRGGYPTQYAGIRFNGASPEIYNSSAASDYFGFNFGSGEIVRIAATTTWSTTCLTSSELSFRRNDGGAYNFKISPFPGSSDRPAGPLTIESGSADASSTTNIAGADLTLSGGNGASGSAGDAHGGDVTIQGGTGYGTGDDGKITLSSVFNVNASYTVSALPTGAVGDVARVTDATSPSVGSTVSGGGSAAALCWYNGTNWTVIGV